MIATGEFPRAAIEYFVVNMEAARSQPAVTSLEDQLYMDSLPRALRQVIAQRARERGLIALADIMESRLDQTKAEAKARIARNLDLLAFVNGIPRSQRERDKEKEHQLVDECYDAD